MALVPRKRYTDPFTELEKLQEEMNTLFDFSLGRYNEKETSLLESTWAPAVDIYDRKDAYVVKADLPGIAKEDIDVTMQHNMLTIRGEKKHEEKSEKKDFVRSERFYGTFQRSLSLPSDIDAGKVKAEYKNGTLELTLPKKEEAKPKQINVTVQ